MRPLFTTVGHDQRYLTICGSLARCGARGPCEPFSHCPQAPGVLFPGASAIRSCPRPSAESAAVAAGLPVDVLQPRAAAHWWLPVHPPAATTLAPSLAGRPASALSLSCARSTGTLARGADTRPPYSPRHRPVCSPHDQTSFGAEVCEEAVRAFRFFSFSQLSILRRAAAVVSCGVPVNLDMVALPLAMSG